MVGHGVAAAAVMAQLRTALRAYAAEGHDPAGVVQSVDRLMWQLGPTAMTTLAYLVLDPLEETLEVVNAGHLPPLLHRAGRRAPGYLSVEGALPLGTSQTEVYGSQVVPFPAGSAHRAVHRRARGAPRRADRRRARPAARALRRAARTSSSSARRRSTSSCRAEPQDDVAWWSPACRR